MRYWTQLATEQFAPSDLVRQAVAAEPAGFDALNVSDHYQPWWEPGHSGHAWPCSARSARPPSASRSAPASPRPCTATTPRWWRSWPPRSRRCSRAARSSGSAPASRSTSPRAGWTGRRWPSRSSAWRRRSRSSTPVRRRAPRPRGPLLRTKAATSTPAPSAGRRSTSRRSAGPPRWPRARRRAVDARRSRSAPDVIDAYRSACDDAGREPGEIILQTGFSWAEDDDAALEGARVWKATMPQEFFTDDWHDPGAMQEKAAGESPTRSSSSSTSWGPTRTASRANPRGRAPRRHRRVPPERFGGGPLRALEIYGERVLPALRGVRA